MLQYTKGVNMKESNNLACNVVNNFCKRKIQLNTNNRYKKESIFAGNAIKKCLGGAIMLNTKDNYIKKSNTPAANLAFKELQMDMLLNTKRQYMNKFNTPVGIEGKQLNQKVMLLNT